jgi:magnesium-transporting ATPase (P-type)
MLNIDTPITVVQMLWINLVMDTLAGLAFGGEQPRAKYMQEPPKRRDEPIINAYMKNQIVVTSVYTALLSLWFLKSPLLQSVFAPQGAGYAMTAFFALFMFTALFSSLAARTHEINLLDHLALNKQFIGIMGAVVILQTALLWLGGAAFRTQPLALGHFALVLLLSFSVIPVDFLRKWILRKKGNAGGT